MYRTKYYTIEELVHPQILKAIGSENAWLRLDEDVLFDIDYIRAEWFKKYGTGVYINRLNIGLDSRGLRPPNDPDGSFYSTHKQGGTFDLEPVNGMMKQFYDFVCNLIKRGKLKKINTVEDFNFTKTWVHASYMNHSKKILVIKP